LDEARNLGRAGEVRSEVKSDPHNMEKTLKKLIVLTALLAAASFAQAKELTAQQKLMGTCTLKPRV
jgi:hypothetical protein